MKPTRICTTILLMATATMLCSCFSVPHLIWPQKDISPTELHAPSIEKKVLIASRQSDFKQALVSRLLAAFEVEVVYIKVIGLKNLSSINPSDYKAVVLINTCMSWDMDRNVNKFIKNHTDLSNTIVLTTSADGAWEPRHKKGNYDALASASQPGIVDSLSQSIVEKIRAKLNTQM